MQWEKEQRETIAVTWRQKDGALSWATKWQINCAIPGGETSEDQDRRLQELQNAIESCEGMKLP